MVNVGIKLKSQRRKINWHIKNSCLNSKYMIILKNMTEENINQGFRLKTIYETRNHFIEQKKKNESICKKHKKVCKL